MVKSMFIVSLIINYFSITILCMQNTYISYINMINTQVISRPGNVCIFMITKTCNWSVLVKLKLVEFIRIAY